MYFRHSSCVFAATLAFALAACAEEPEAAQAQPDLLEDPMLARALNDPLMIDPDMAWSNEANAVITYRDGHPLPPMVAREDAADRAREAARRELLDGGDIPPVADAVPGAGGTDLAALQDVKAIFEALDVWPDCLADVTSSLNWSTKLSETVGIMPHGMVQQAAGADRGECAVRILRYVTPAAVEDVLEYHHTKMERARFRIERFDTPEVQLRGERRDQVLAVHIRKGAGNMTEVDVAHWRK